MILTIIVIYLIVSFSIAYGVHKKYEAEVDPIKKEKLLNMYNFLTRFDLTYFREWY